MPCNSSFLRNHFLVFVLIIIIISCKSKLKETSESIGTPTFETEEFLQFYDKFGKDSLFQMEHTVFPLEGMQRLKDTLDLPDKNFRWKQENWVIHRPYNDMDGTFSREFLDLHGIVIERIADASGKYSMERRFAKLSVGWHLIYYREMGMY